MSREMPDSYGAAGEPARLESGPDTPAVPGLDVSENPNGSFVFNIDVDGEQFAVYKSDAGRWSYEWLTGPNSYGFGVSGPPIRGVEQHRDRIREFLRDIDPATGYLRED
jgi:hypothetical protein